MVTWLLSETLRAWGTDDLASLLEQARAYDREVTVFDVQAASLSGRDVRPVHVVGGAQNTLLCQLLADRLGNLLVQGRAHGVLSGSLEDLRELVARPPNLP